MARFVTFYSYKGGVGRSMALANIACLMAEDEDHPQRVLLWDFDLEAPGLHRLIPSTTDITHGFVDLAYDFAQTDKLDEVSPFIYHTAVPNIHLLPAGRVDSVYCERLESINWPGFFDETNKHKNAFFQQLKTWISHAGYDYVLIDSRTGLHDVASICTQLLGELNIVIFRLTEQNLDGLAHVVPTILKRRSVTRDGLDALHTDIIPLASVVMSQPSADVSDRLERAKEIFGVRKLKYIRFDPDLVVSERLFCLRKVKSEVWPVPPIVTDYRRLCDQIRSANPDDTRTSSRQINELMDAADFVGARSRIGQVLRRRPRNVQLWRHLRTIAMQSSAFVEECDKLADDIDRASDGNNPFCCEWRASRLVASADSPEAAELMEALALLQRAVTLEPENVRLQRQLAEIEGVVGHLEAATQALQVAHQQAPNNDQISDDLAHMFVRRGRNYFVYAAEILAEAQVSGLSPLGLYLNTFLGKDATLPAIRSDQLQAIDIDRSEDRKKLIECHRLTLAGELEAAVRLAESWIDTRKQMEKSEAANWAEFFICAERPERAIELLQAELASESDGYRGVFNLAQLFASPTGVSTDTVVDTWEDYGWGFLELLFYRERRALRGDVAFDGIAPVIERLIRKCSLFNPYGDAQGSVFWRRRRGSARIAHRGKQIGYKVS